MHLVLYLTESVGKRISRGLVQLLASGDSLQYVAASHYSMKDI
jgi:hypothetical protein